jgi:hypothetical protein
VAPIKNDDSQTTDPFRRPISGASLFALVYHHVTVIAAFVAYYYFF